MAVAPVAQMETLLTCSICLETLQDPRTLACFHSFCKPCLEKFVKRERDRKVAEAARTGAKDQGKPGDVQEFNCPVCRCDFCLKQGEGVGEMTPNHFISNMLEVLAIQRRAKKIPCSLCEGLAVCRCTNCNRFLCSKCFSAHENWLELKNHVVLTMDELAIPENQAKARRKSYCQKHQNKSLKFYCETCEELVCRYCMDFIHARESHLCVLVEEVAEKERESIKQCCGVLEESLDEGEKALKAVCNVMQSLDKTADQAKNEVNQQMQNVLEALTLQLKEKTKLMINKVDQKYQETWKPLAKQKSELEAYVKQIKGSLDLSKNLVEKGNDEEILSSKRMIKKSLVKVKNECPNMEPSHDGNIQFSAETADFGSVVDNFCKIDLVRMVENQHTLKASKLTVPRETFKAGEPKQKVKMKPRKPTKNVPESTSEKQATNKVNTVIVSGFSPRASDTTVELFFESKKRSGGGEIEKFQRVDPQVAYITFTNSQAREHLEIDGYRLEVKAEESQNVSQPSNEKPVISKVKTVIVNGICPQTTDDTLLCLFGNPRRSGGGDIEKFERIDIQVAHITFTTSQVASRVLAREDLEVDGYRLQLKAQTLQVFRQ